MTCSLSTSFAKISTTDTILTQNITIAISKQRSMPVTDFLNGIEGIVG